MMGRQPKHERHDPRYAPGAPGPDEIEPYLDFDFAGHFEAVSRAERPDTDHVFLLMLWYARDGGDVPRWVHDELSGRFLAVLRDGAAWRAAFPLPWLPAPTAAEIHSRASIREYEMGAAVLAMLDDYPEQSVNDACNAVAEKFHASPRHVERALHALRERLSIPSRRTGKNS